MTSGSIAIVLSLVIFSPGMVPAQTNARSPAAKENSVYAELTRAPKKASARRNPFAGNPESVQAGANLFELHCAECHEAEAGGGKKAPSLRADEVQQATPGTLFWILTNGVVRRGMPVWSRLPEPQRWQLVSYIKSLSATSSSKSDTEFRVP